MITSENVVLEAQFTNFVISWKWFKIKKVEYLKNGTFLMFRF